MATYKISIYERMVQLTTDDATCELPDDFTSDDMREAAVELLSRGPYHSTDAAYALEEADSPGSEWLSDSDMTDADLRRVDIIQFEPYLDDDGEVCASGDGDWQVVATVEIAPK